jgi:hypothetical protein
VQCSSAAKDWALSGMSQATGTGHSKMHPHGASAPFVGACIDKNFGSKDEERAARHGSKDEERAARHGSKDEERAARHKENLNMQLLGKMMESGWKDDWWEPAPRLVA